ncbi:urease accessory protein UreD [Thiocapsa bogorovii]|uniref:urease accessory protein UreD n=1 Tax=Thiocapsa bogorovii TaxID=521689 RepID=UPI001E3AD2A1|nr:urease accessory protein UreD [Thiocapsa bogorovii]UHD14371.1 urease accessory protein UreD [Thiocapsa bogorovii]
MITGVPGTAACAGWQARLQLEIALRHGYSRVVAKHQLGPLAIQRPFYPEGSPCHLYLLHPPGGVVGGDDLEVDIRVGSGAHALVTSPGATKFYRSAGPRGRQRQRFAIAGDGILEWFPHENIFFPGAFCALDTRIELAEDACFVGWEIQCLGRPAIAERFREGRADLALTLLRNAKPLMTERLRVAGNASLDGPAGLRGFPVSATFLATGADRDVLEIARGRLADAAGYPVGATLIDDLLLIRALAREVEPVSRLFVALWSDLRPSLLGLGACAPRIWAT